jgi:hypothetical protein
LRLIASSLHRKVGWLLALEDAIDTAGGAQEVVDLVRAVGDHTAAHDMTAVGVDRRQAVPRRKRDDQLAVMEPPARSTTRSSRRSARGRMQRQSDGRRCGRTKR